MASPIPDLKRLHVATLIAQPVGNQVIATALGASPLAKFELHTCGTIDDALTLLGAGECHALIIGADAPVEAQAAVTDAALDMAVLVVVAALEPAVVRHWQAHGAQDVLLRSELGSATFALRVCGAVARKRLERDARTAYATDLDTGLPHQQQFIEHVSQLLALREREPAPMAVLALRIEGFATTQAQLGQEAANVLRRKVGVRLRAGLRASDVVAALGDDNFAVLLGSILAPADAIRVGAKLTMSLRDPFKIAGQQVAIASALGIAQYPQDGTQPEVLLRRAVGLAAAETAQGRAGFSNFGEIGGAAIGAANDDSADD